MNEYQKYFGLFQKNTDEKKMLLKEITKIIKERKITSLLDIGAGDGKLAIPLSKKVKEYCAIEEKPQFVKILKKAGLTTIEGKFPEVNIDKKFDIVLCSHSLYFVPGSYEAFLEQAWNATHPKHGIMVVVLRKGKKGESWIDLGNSIGIPPTNPKRLSYNKIIDLFSRLGKVEEKKLVSYAVTQSINEMIDVLSFTLAVRRLKTQQKFLSKRKEIAQILNAKYKTKEGYRFPLEHQIVIISHRN